jgi:hypothetical protein
MFRGSAWFVWGLLGLRRKPIQSDDNAGKVVSRHYSTMATNFEVVVTLAHVTDDCFQHFNLGA